MSSLYVTQETPAGSDPDFSLAVSVTSLRWHTEHYTSETVLLRWLGYPFPFWSLTPTLTRNSARGQTHGVVHSHPDDCFIGRVSSVGP